MMFPGHLAPKRQPKNLDDDEVELDEAAALRAATIREAEEKLRLAEQGTAGAGAGAGAAAHAGQPAARPAPAGVLGRRLQPLPPAHPLRGGRRRPQRRGHDRRQQPHQDQDPQRPAVPRHPGGRPARVHQEGLLRLIVRDTVLVSSSLARSWNVSRL